MNNISDWGYTAGAVIIMGLVTFGLRATPFMAAKWLQRHDLVLRLGRFLPLAIIRGDKFYFLPFPTTHQHSFSCKSSQKWDSVKTCFFN